MNQLADIGFDPVYGALPLRQSQTSSSTHDLLPAVDTMVSNR
jgi:hypothetical protein